MPPLQSFLKPLKNLAPTPPAICSAASPPVSAFFLPPGWQLAAGILPAFWPMKMLWLAVSGEGYTLYAAAGLAVNAAALALLLRRFDVRMHRI